MLAHISSALGFRVGKGVGTLVGAVVGDTVGVGISIVGVGGFGISVLEGGGSSGLGIASRRRGLTAAGLVGLTGDAQAASRAARISKSEILFKSFDTPPMVSRALAASLPCCKCPWGTRSYYGGIEA
jgi:hypothetical protein